MRVSVIDHSIVAIFDIESFTTRDLPNQANLIEGFVDGLNSALAELSDLGPSAWSTGDGAIVSIGNRCEIDSDALRRFMEFAIEFTGSLLADGVIIRTVVNAGDRDRIIALDPDLPFKGDFVQIGHTINDAARLMIFCEPRELLVSDTVVRSLSDLGLASAFRFFPNEPFVTKHMQRLQTHTYVAPEEWADVFYSPRSELHKYKRFSSFPPIKSSTLSYFEARGLDFEIGRVVRAAYAAMESINTTKTFLSWSSVLRVLGQLSYDETDRVLVISRNDYPGFWTQNRRAVYLRDLERIAERHGAINQTRVMVWGDDGREVMTPKDRELHERLLNIHGPNSFYSFPGDRIFKYELVDSLVFGFTVSVKHRLAIIPIPAPEEADISNLSPNSLGEIMKRYENYDAADGPMKAVITANADFVDLLISEVEAMIISPEADRLK